MPTGLSIPTAIPGLYQTQGVQTRDDLTGLDPESMLEAQNLNRRQQIANLLMQRGLQPLHGQQVGRFYVRPNWAEGLNQLAQAGLGAFLTNRFGKEQAELGKQQQEMTAEAVRRYQEGMQGTPAATVPEGVAGPERPALPATEDTKRQAIIGAMASRVPGLRAMAQYDLQQMNRPPITVNQGDKTVLLDPTTMQPRATLPMGVTPSAQLQADVTRETHRTAGGAAELQAKTQREIEQAKETAASARQEKELAQRQQFHITPSADALARISAEGTIALQAHNQKVAEFEERKKQDAAKLELEQQKFGSTEAYQKARLEMDQKHLAQAADLHKEEMDLRKQLHLEPSGSSLANVDAQAAIALQNHQDRMAQFEQNKRQDEATLELRKNQYANDEAYKRDKMAMEERHQQQQVGLEKERLEIMKMFKQSQEEKNSPQAKRDQATYQAGLKEVERDQKAVDQAGMLRDSIRRWRELQPQVQTGPITGRRPLSFDPNYQELKQLENKLAMNNFKPGQGQMSNFERGLIIGGGPNTTNDPQTNMNITKIMEGMAQNIEDHANFKEWYLEQHGKTLGADKAWNEYLEANPHVTQDKNHNIIDNPNRQDWQTYFAGGKAAPAPTRTAPAPGGMPTIKSDADYNALPPGTVFIGPDGKQRKKP